MSESETPRRRGNPNWTKGVSGNPSGKRKDAADVPISQLLAEAGIDTWRTDGWQNALTGLGRTSHDKRLGTSFVGSRGITWPEAMSMWLEDDLAARVIEVPPNEMLRQGWKLCIGSGKAAKDREEAVRTRCQELGVNDKFRTAMCYERAYGGGAVFLGIRDGRGLNEPVNEKAIRGLDWITTIEPRELTPVGWYADPKAPRFNDVAIWRYTPTIQGPNVDGRTPIAQASIDIHESRLIIFDGIKVSSVQVAQAYGWGGSVFDRVQAVLRDFASAWAGAGLLAADFAPPVFKMKGLAEAIATDKGQVLRNRIAAIELARGLARLVLVDAEREEFKRETVNIAGLPELLDKFASRFAAAADMPLTLLMGVSPGGLNATGDSDIRFFYDRMKSAQTNKLAPALERVVKLILLSTGGDPDHWTITFNPLWQPTDKEVADTRLVNAQADALGCQWGWLTPEDARKRYVGDAYNNDIVIEEDEEDDGDEYLDPSEVPVPGDQAAPTGEGDLEQAAPPADTAVGPGMPTTPKSPPGAAPAGAPKPPAPPKVGELVELVQAVGKGEVPRESALGILRVSFGLGEEAAASILPPEGWEMPEPDPPPMPPGGAPPPKGGPPAPPAPRADYSPDQPRAENGQFGEGGGGSAREAYDRASADEERVAGERYAAEDDHDQAVAEVDDLRGEVRAASAAIKDADNDEDRAAAREYLERTKADLERARARVAEAKTKVKAAKAKQREAMRAVEKASGALDE